MKTKHLITLFALSLSFADFSHGQAPFAEATPVPDYIRYQSGDGAEQPDVLETAISRFQKGNHILDLVSVVHLGDEAYFARLKQILTGYDAVFYEMVGGPYTEETRRASKNAASPQNDISQVQGLQQMAKKLLGLEFQLDGLDYLAPNFVHADMTHEQFSKHSDEAGIANMLTRALKIAQSGNVPGIPSAEGAANQLMTDLMGAVLTGNSSQLKKSLGPILAEAESFITKMEDEDGTVLITRRNEIVIEKVEENLATRGPGPKKDAILYGAGHMPDLESRLKKLGYRKSATAWEASWVIKEGSKSGQGSPSLDEIMKQVGGLMKMINGDSSSTR